MNSIGFYRAPAPTEPLRFVDHTYRDYSRFLEAGGKLITHKKSTDNFPARLHRILSNEEHSDVICWMPHGRAWKILDKRRFMEEVAPKYYVNKKFASFVRQLSGWGFKRLHQKKDFGCYYHECFLRGVPEITCLIRRLPPGKGRTIPSIDCEPDFYTLARLHPLPDRTTKSEGLPSSEVKPRNLVRLKDREEQPARKNETAELSRSPPAALSNARLEPSRVLKHPREISTDKSKKMKFLERAKAEVDIAFARGYVPDYQVIVDSFPTAEERKPAQVQAQMRSAASQEGMLARSPTLLVDAPQPVSAIPVNLWVDIHGRAIGFSEVNYSCGSPQPPTMQRQHNLAMQRIHGMPPPIINSSFEGANASRRIHNEMPPPTAVGLPMHNDDGFTPHHVKMHQKLYNGSDKVKPIYIHKPAASEDTSRL